VHKKAVALASGARAAGIKLKEERAAAELLRAEISGLGKKLSDLSLERQSTEGRIKSAEDRAVAAEDRAKAAEDKAKDAIDRANAAEAKFRELQVEQRDMLAAADENGFKRGEQEAGKQYLRESAEIEVASFKKGYRLGHVDCFPSAYTRGVDARCALSEAEARVVPPIPEPQIPEMPEDELEDDVEEGEEDGQEEHGEDTHSEPHAD
jgi:hypothetical protein